MSDNKQQEERCEFCGDILPALYGTRKMCVRCSEYFNGRGKWVDMPAGTFGKDPVKIFILDKPNQP